MQTFVILFLLAFIGPSLEAKGDSGSCSADDPNCNNDEEGTLRDQIDHWRVTYFTMDINDDGILSTADRDTFITRVMEFINDNDILLKIGTWFDKYVLHGRQELSVSEHAEMLAEEFKILSHSDFMYNQKLRMRRLFYWLDIDKDGFISEDEFRVLWNVFGRENISVDIEHAFNSYQPEDGKVPLDTIADEWAVYANTPLDD